jgi:hypothetical protein
MTDSHSIQREVIKAFAVFVYECASGRWKAEVNAPVRRL